MNYFQFEFNVYIALVAIVMVGVVKAIANYRQVRKSDKVNGVLNNSKVYDLLPSIFALLGMTSAMFFQGVIADISRESGLLWLNNSMYLFITSIVLFNIQVIFMVLTDMRIRKIKD